MYEDTDDEEEYKLKVLVLGEVAVGQCAQVRESRLYWESYCAFLF